MSEENSEKKVRGVVLGMPVQTALRSLIDQATPFGKGRGGAAFIADQTGVEADQICAAALGSPVKTGHATMLTNLATGRFTLTPPTA